MNANIRQMPFPHELYLMVVLIKPPTHGLGHGSNVHRTSIGITENGRDAVIACSDNVTLILPYVENIVSRGQCRGDMAQRGASHALAVTLQEKGLGVLLRLLP